VIKPTLCNHFRTFTKIIRFAVKLYARFPLSQRNVENLLHTACVVHLPPSERQIDLRQLLYALPLDLPLAVDVPMLVFARTKGSEAVLRLILEAAQQLLDRDQHTPRNWRFDRAG
jgi:hypothetical protein